MNSSLSFINIRQGKFNEANENIYNYIYSPGATKQTKAIGIYIKSLNLFEKGDYNKALDTCLAAKDKFDSEDIVTRNHDMHWLLAQLYIKNNFVSKALEELVQMEEIISKYSIDATNYHKVLKYKLHIEALIATKSNKVTVLDSIVIIFKTQLQSKIKDHGSSFGPAYFNTSFAEMYRNLGNNSRAEELLKDAISYADNFPMAHYYLWQLYESMNRPEDAINEKLTFNRLWETADKDLKSIFGI